MAVRNYYVANPTGVDITTNAKTAKARRVTSLAFDDAALANGWTDLVVFLAGGCLVVSALQATMEQKQIAAELVQVEEQDVIGAGGLA